MRPLAIVAVVMTAGLLGCGTDTETGLDPDNASLEGEKVTVTSQSVISQTSTTQSSISQSSTDTAGQSPLFDFSVDESALGWNVVNDTVMGGVSVGELNVDIQDNDSLVFTGVLSLANNGGFASVRGPLIEPLIAKVWASRPGPRIVAEGDGRTWTVEVRTDAEPGGWIANFPTSPNEITDVTIPWTSFEPVTRFLDPRDAAEPLDPQRIMTIAFYLVDGIEGPFRLGIRSIS